MYTYSHRVGGTGGDLNQREGEMGNRGELLGQPLACQICKFITFILVERKDSKMAKQYVII
jgi:hypothetical protein